MGHQNWLFKEGDWMKVWNGEEKVLADKPDNHTYYRVTKRKNGSWRTSGSDLYVQMNCWRNYYYWEF